MTEDWKSDVLEIIHEAMNNSSRVRLEQLNDLHANIRSIVRCIMNDDHELARSYVSRLGDLFEKCL